MGRRGGGAVHGARGQSKSARKPALPHTEAYQRMNFLYHAAHQVVATNPALARLYIRNMVLVAQKLVLRIDATVKTTYCKGCFSLLIPGLSASARVAHGARRRYLVTCQHCGKAKRSMIHPPKPPLPEGDAMAVASTEPGEKGPQLMEGDRREEKEAPGQEEEEGTGLTESATRRERCLEVPKNHHSRFVYTNPTCLLTAKGARADEPPHVAFVSRLSCINNNGLFFCALSKHLPGVATLGANSCFVLNVPVAGMEESIRCYAAAAEQAEEGDGAARTPECGLQVCKPGWFPRDEEASEEPTGVEAELSAGGGKGARGKNKPRGAIRAEMRQKKRDIVRGELDAKLKGNLALYECVAHIECSVESRDEAEGQVLLYAMIERVWVQPEYWTGKTFVHTREDVPPYLAYLGDGRFGYKHS